MKAETIEILFDTIDEMAMVLTEQTDLDYLNALAAASQNILEHDILQEVETDIEVMLFNLVKKVSDLDFSREEIRKALQLALLKGLKSTNTSLDLITPEAIGMFMGYLVNLLTGGTSGLKIADLTVGTGNLLTTILNLMPNSPAEIYGIDIHYQLLELAKMMLDMQDYEGQFYQQTSVATMNIPKLDVIIGDLPVEDVEEKEDYLPYALILNHMNYLVEGGFGIYLITNDFFSQEGAADFHAALTIEGRPLMMLQLPEDLFKDASMGKSIFVIQKIGEEKATVSEVLALPLPSFSDAVSFRQIIVTIEGWVNKHVKVGAS